MDGMEARSVAERVDHELRALGDPSRAVGERAYLKSDLDFFGVKLAEIRRIARVTWHAHRSTGRSGLVALAEELWHVPIFERRMAAAILLELGVAELGIDDLPLLERLIRESRTWALVDWLAGDVVATMRASDSAVEPTLARWSTDADFWVRRAALLGHLRRVRAGEPLGPFADYADAMLDEREFFIRKAIAWVLREAGKRRPDEVAAWLSPRTHRASGVTMREAVKYLPAADSERLLFAYREKRHA